MKEAKVLNWIAVVWTVLGILALLEDMSGMDMWSFVYMGVLLAAQITALKTFK